MTPTTHAEGGIIPSGRSAGALKRARPARRNLAFPSRRSPKTQQTAAAAPRRQAFWFVYLRPPVGGLQSLAQAGVGALPPAPAHGGAAARALGFFSETPYFKAQPGG